MKALKYTKGLHPLLNSDYSWVYIHKNPYGLATINKNESYIFVDADVAQYLKDNKVDLMWAAISTHHQTVRIKSINGIPANTLLANANTNPYKTLTQIVSGKRGRTRLPKHSYHGNDWTRSAFDLNHKKPLTELSDNDIIIKTIGSEHIPIPNSLFDVPVSSIRMKGSNHPYDKVVIGTPELQILPYENQLKIKKQFSARLWWITISLVSVVAIIITIGIQ